MPFVKNDCRMSDHSPCCVGDQCYQEYIKLVDSWKLNRRWTTAHNLLKDLLELTDEETASLLAYAVFFTLHVMPYEIEKRSQNGDI